MDFTDPDANVAHLNLAEGSKVAVFGSGAGGHSFALSRALNNTGSIHAIDVRENMLEMLLNNAKLEGVHNVYTVHANIEGEGGTKITPMSLDAVVIPNTLFSYEDRPGIFREAKRILKPHGKVLVVEWKASYGGVGPQAENVVTEDMAIEMAKAEGFSVLEQFSAGGQHYGLVLEKH